MPKSGYPMSSQPADPADLAEVAIGEDLKLQLAKLIDALTGRSEEKYEAAFVHLLDRAQELVDRKRAMEGSKSDTRDMIGELLFSRLRQAMRLFQKTKDAREEIRAAEWSIGCLFSIATLTELANAFDQVMIRQGMGRDFSFAGRTDFITVEEVLQMLGGGKHVGCLSLEKGDNRLDIYLKDGLVAFLDPHHMIRRVMPTTDRMRHREIPEGVVALAEAERKQNGTPVFLTLMEQGHFKAGELREAMRHFGKEVVFDFMREKEPYAFFYRRCDKLPAFAEQSNLRMSVMSMLLEISKQLDDWRGMLKVFPDPDAALEPRADMFARMADAALGPMEIKLLSQLNGETTPRGLVPMLGVPLFEVYGTLVRLAREGILSPPGGMQALSSVSNSVQESLQMAFEALDANEDGEGDDSGEEPDDDSEDGGDGMDLSALDKVFGGDKKKAAGKKSKAGDSGNPMQKELLELLRRNRKGSDSG